jgi:para-nitrobenzyl esterase
MSSRHDMKAKLPVLVWIHGGGYFDGASNDYDAAKLVTKGKLVVVTLNYRLNLFGFMAHPALTRKATLRQLRHDGHAGGLRMGAAEHRGFRRRSKQRHLGGQSAGAGATRQCLVAGRERPVPSRHLPERRLYAFRPQIHRRRQGKKFAAAGLHSGDIAKCLRALPAAKIERLPALPAKQPLITNPWWTARSSPGRRST